MRELELSMNCNVWRFVAMGRLKDSRIIVEFRFDNPRGNSRAEAIQIKLFLTASNISYQTCSNERDLIKLKRY